MELINHMNLAKRMELMEIL